MLHEKDLRIQSLVEEMDQIRNEFQEKEKEKEKRIYNLDKDFTEFKEQNQVKIDIGEKLLKLSKTKKWKGSIRARRLYGLAYAQLPAASAKYLSQLIPVTIAAFLCDADIDTHFDDLEFIAGATPCDKKLSECVMLLHELVKYKIADYTNKGAIWSLVHDKGDRNKLGRLIRVLSMLNKFGRFDPHFNDGVVSIKIDADGVACKDDDLISHIENTFRGIEPYLKHLDSVACAFKYRDSFGRIYHIMYVITCALHGHSKPLEKAWLSAFSKFGLGEKNVGQFVYECWYIQDRLGEKFKQRWELINYWGKVGRNTIVAKTNSFKMGIPHAWMHKGLRTF